MELSNFRLVERTGKSALSWKFKAIVTVTTTTTTTVKTKWFMPDRDETKTKTEDVQIYKVFAGNWCFVETGEYTPGVQAENLQRKFEASIMGGIEDCEIPSK